MNSPSFQEQFFSRTMAQSFNARVNRFQSDENEPALRKWLRATGRLK